MANEKINILMVDDQPGKLLSYEVVLGALGENLLKAQSAREALEHLLREDIAVVLIDVCMPELDGFELAAMIREHPRFAQISIIFVSAVQITDLDRLRGYEAGAVDYVPVPVVPEVLRAKVRVFADLYRKTRALERLNAELERRVAERTAALEASTAQLKALNEGLERKIEERTNERELALAQLFEAQKLDTIGRLTGGVAHDFNNLLMAVLGSLELLRKRLPDEPRLISLVDNALQGARRGSALTQRLLAFARRQELKPEAVQISHLVRGMQDLLARALGPGIRFDNRVADSTALVCVDANQLELALLNLAVNARDAMPLSGTFTMMTAPALEQVPVPRHLAPGNYVCIRVIDTGIGMDAATLERATEPFFTTKGPGKGTGLGLSMVHGLALQSGGAMNITSAPNIGTTVDLWLPQAEPDAVATNIAISDQMLPEARGSGGLTILVVDDDPLVCMGTAAIVEDLGHTVLEATSGEQALAIMTRGAQIDLVITDHAMPVMTGTELALRIRQFRPDMPIILASGYADIPEEQRSNLDLPRLAKPYTQEEVEVAINGCLGGAVRVLRAVSG